MFCTHRMRMIINIIAGWRMARLAIATIVAMVVLTPPPSAYGGNGANFILYNHHSAYKGEMELMMMNDIGTEPDGTRYTAQMVEFEVGVTEKLTTEFMIEGQATSPEEGYIFTGFRWENRYRFFDYGTFLNPVFYVEYEDLSDETKYVMEVASRTDAKGKRTARPRERVLETRFILGQDLTDNLDVSLNWINESNLDSGITEFGYATGLNFSMAIAGRSARYAEKHLSGPGVKKSNGFDVNATVAAPHRDYAVTFGLEFYGGLGNNDEGITADGDVTEHYMSPNILIHTPSGWMVKLGFTIGLTDVSRDIFRSSIGWEF